MNFLSVSALPTLEPGGVPLHVQIAEGLLRLISMEGKKAIGKLLPSETDCVEHFGVSRLTVRQAMSSLHSRGIIARRRGRGTFVTGLPLDHYKGRAFEDDMRAGCHNSTVRLLEWKRVPMPEEIAQIFKFEDTSEIYRLRRLRLIDGKIRSLEERYIPTVIGDRISASELDTQSLFTLLRKLTGEKQANMRFVVSVGSADAALAKMLKVPRRTTLVVRKNTCYFHNDRPLMHGTVRFVARNYQFRFNVRMDLTP